jgi:hypothetical protein
VIFAKNRKMNERLFKIAKINANYGKKWFLEAF